jgi:hypothetical protein
LDSDVEHLRLLVIFHYVLAGITALMSLFPIIHLTVGVGMVRGQLGANNTAIEPLVGWFFVIFSSALIVAGLAFSACLVVAARFLKSRRHYFFGSGMRVLPLWNCPRCFHDYCAFESVSKSAVHETIPAAGRAVSDGVTGSNAARDAARRTYSHAQNGTPPPSFARGAAPPSHA